MCMVSKERIAKDGYLLLPVDVGQNEGGHQTFNFKTLELDGALVIMAFATQSEK